MFKQLQTKFFALLAIMLMGGSSAWADTATLSNANIVAAGDKNSGYKEYSIPDGNGKKWNAYAIKNQHSNATSGYHYLQIKKYASNTAYYLQVPEYGTKITSITMTVSGSSQPMTGGGNTATLFFSSSNETSAIGTGVASGTGASSVTIDCSSLDLNTGYITASGAVRIWDVTITYSTSTTSTPYITANDVNIGYDATSGAITYTVNNGVDGGVVTASTTSNWLTLGTVGENVPFTCASNSETTARTATVTLTYTYGEETVTKNVIVTQAAAPVAYTTIPALFEAATSTSTPVNVTFGNWVVTGVNGSQLFVTDGTYGFIVYQSDHGFKVGDILSGTASCNLVLFGGSAELTGLTSTTSGLTVETGGSVTPVATTIDALGAVNTGSVVTLSNLTYDGSNLSDGTNTIIPWSTLHTGTYEDGKTYNVTGVFVLNNSSKRILPRSAADIVEVVSVEPSITLSTYTIEATADGANGTITVTYNNITDVEAEVLFYAADGTTSASYDWITAEINNDNNISYQVTANTGDARTAYMKVYALDDNVNDVYSELITITQAAAPGIVDNYELFTGDLVEGDYLIFYDGKAMNTTVTSDRLQYAEVTPINDVITTDDATIVWHIAPSGEYWTIYNADADAYAASTGAKNKAQMLADGTDDKALWTVSGTETYEFVNKKNTDNNANANLRNNGTYGFACYSTGTGGALSLYKKVEATPTQTVSISSVGMATFCSENALDFTGLTDMYAYIALYNNDKVTYRKVTKVPARTGVLLRNPNGGATSHEVPVLTGAADEVEGNKFIGTLTDITALASVDADETNTNYILNNGENGVGFYKAAGQKVGAGKAYLQLPTNAAKTFIGFDEEGEATAISTIDNGQLTMDNVYNLQGQKVGSEYKGIVIVNGKKFINK